MASREHFPDIDDAIARYREAASIVLSKGLRRIERMPNNPFPQDSEWGDMLDDMWRKRRGAIPSAVARP